MGRLCEQVSSRWQLPQVGSICDDGHLNGEEVVVVALVSTTEEEEEEAEDCIWCDLHICAFLLSSLVQEDDL